MRLAAARDLDDRSPKGLHDRICKLATSGENLPHVTAVAVRSRVCSGDSAWKIRTGMRQADSFRRQAAYLED
jgi:hypothetical protein